MVCDSSFIEVLAFGVSWGKAVKFNEGDDTDLETNS